MGNERRLIAPIAVTAPLLLLPACRKDEPTPVVEPTSAFQPTGSTGSAAATGSTGTTGETGGIEDLPTTSPGSATGNISSGRAAFTVTGGIRTSKALTITVQSKNAITTLISSAGECRITIGSPAPIRSRERSPARISPAVRARWSM